MGPMLIRKTQRCDAHDGTAHVFVQGPFVVHTVLTGRSVCSAAFWSASAGRLHSQHINFSSKNIEAQYELAYRIPRPSTSDGAYDAFDGISKTKVLGVNVGDSGGTSVGQGVGRRLVLDTVSK